MQAHNIYLMYSASCAPGAVQIALVKRKNRNKYGIENLCHVGLNSGQIPEYGLNRNQPSYYVDCGKYLLVMDALPSLKLNPLNNLLVIREMNANRY